MEEAFNQIRSELRATLSEYQKYVENAKVQEYIGKFTDPITKGINSTLSEIEERVGRALTQSNLGGNGPLDESCLMDCHDAFETLVRDFKDTRRAIENLKGYSNLKLTAPIELYYHIDRLDGAPSDGTFFGTLSSILEDAGPIFPQIPRMACYLTDDLFFRLRTTPETTVHECMRQMSKEVYYMLRIVPATENAVLSNDLGNAVTYARQIAILYYEDSPLDRRDMSLHTHILGDFRAAYHMVGCLSSMVWVIKEIVRIVVAPKPSDPEYVDWDSELYLRQSQLQLINIICDSFLIDCRSTLKRKHWNIDRARGAHSKDEIIIPDHVKRKLDSINNHHMKISPTATSLDGQSWTIDRVRNELGHPSTGLAELPLDFTQIAPIGNGAFGEVSAVKWKGSKVQVAIKHAKVKANDQLGSILKDFTRETLIWSQLRHDNILRLLGFCYREALGFVDIALISPCYERGNLNAYVHSSELLERVRLELIRDVACAMTFLHDDGMRNSGCIVHGDIRAANVLINNTGRALLCDFGLSHSANMEDRFERDSYLTNERWLAYELVINRKNSPKTTSASDVYAFGCLCLEVMHGELPYAECGPDSVAGSLKIRIIIRKKEKKPPAALYPTSYRVQFLRNLLEKCWHAEPSCRPTARTVLEVLEYMITRI